ncbi:MULTISPECIES: hypothetical protein [unclassified Gordonia (in: high G+C Gram-positive bacteria)]
MDKRRWMSAVLLTAGLAIGVTACGSDASEPVSGDSNSIDVPASSALSGSWTGTWKAGGRSSEAHLGVVSDNPFLATVDVAGSCGATWKETSREGSTVTATSTVTYGNCPAGDWTITITDTSITATGGDVTAQFHRD